MLLKINQVIWAELPKRGPIWAKLDARRRFRASRITEHELILRAITERNPEHARAAARAHLQATINDYLEEAGAADPAEPETLPVQKADR